MTHSRSRFSKIPARLLIRRVLITTAGMSLFSSQALRFVQGALERGNPRFYWTRPAAGMSASHSLDSQAFISGSSLHDCTRVRRRRTCCSRSQTGMRMVSELSKTAIHTMRVKELRQELESRGLEATGIRPVLQARLGEAAAIERAREQQPGLHRQSSRASKKSSTTTTAFIPRMVRRDNHTLATPAGPAQVLEPAESSAALHFLPENAETGDAKGVDLAGVRISAKGGMASTISSTESGLFTPLSPKVSAATQFVLQFDGGSRGNPGPSGAGAVLYRVNDSEQRQEVYSGSVWLGENATNNEAEYSGLLEGLQAAKKLGIKRLAVEGDSTLVIQQMRRKFKVKSEKMRPKFEEATSLAAYFDDFKLDHIARALNSRADTLVNVAIDSRNIERITDPYFHASRGEQYSTSDE